MSINEPVIGDGDYMKHSELPWEYEGVCYTDNGGKYRSIISENYANEIINDCGVMSEEDAEFIVKACNNHYELLWSCKLALDHLPKHTSNAGTERVRDALKAAIEKAS